ncbi:hypothetical protein VIBNISFn27_900024 [Vibrio nigripulchritudo SFn27]|uniref:Uncharacterized protein n=1 Tax=Vibrio nigripulchritudo TaxID=28173 RepID=U4KHT3_9VIBR|nr:hypothetical protein VIBNIBLFn1_210024 [Vibrio nigripulchritudo BLFn1]CCN91217.1 hypothetical protein VIBNISFn27_900024 [Vibrio nigripulchritudo SFn27]CCN96316.1 hypothetical protein VIBNIENn2_740024 [Vibrio nigripulchritudo ENn2]CCO38532.1 hypothetical protein VIBNISFn135_1010024 [Vibrio nigripulchritudo SFn135]CCO50439.1 hypothetical protein VIBNIWn13_100038 [Vibrio nigripulchritudo Wn13]CCO61534.1 hypothetical protein VIBNI_B1809 [Vibrio nigripulchritudo]
MERFLSDFFLSESFISLFLIEFNVNMLPLSNVNNAYTQFDIYQCVKIKKNHM